MIRIVTDSTCDLPVTMLRQHAIQVVPVHIQFGTETYQDRVTIDSETFYRRISELGQLPRTSQPTPQDFAEVYESLVNQASMILSIHLSSKLSGTFQSAQVAMQMVADKIKVYVFDSWGGSGSLGFMCLETARMVEAGQPVEEILRRLEEIRARMNIFFTVASLEFARMSGRVGLLQSALASLLDVKPIIGVSEGMMTVVERVRSRRRALDRIVELVRNRVEGAAVNVAVIHAQAPQEAQALLERVRQELNCAETFVNELALGVAVHLGPGTLGVVAYPV